MRTLRNQERPAGNVIGPTIDKHVTLWGIRMSSPNMLSESDDRSRNVIRHSAGMRMLTVVATMVTTAACSVNEYAAPITSFASATKNAETALNELNKQVTDAYTAKLRSNALEGKLFINRMPQDCLVGSHRCRGELTSRDGLKYPFPPESALQNMQIVMGEISTYATNLDTLVNADTAAQVKPSVDAALGSAQNIASTVAKVAAGPNASQPPSVPQFATPVGSAVNWLVGQYVVHVKLDGLRTATSAARKPIDDAADLFETAAGFASDPQRRILADAVSDRIDAFRSSASAPNFDAYTKAVTTYDQFLLAKPSDVFQRMREAHDALADHLNDEKISFGMVQAKIQGFANEATQLANIVKALAAIVKEEK